MGKMETVLRGNPVPSAHSIRDAYRGARPSASGILNAQTIPVLLVALEAVLITAACYLAGAFYHQMVFGHLPFASFYLLATFCLAAMFVLPCGFARDYSVKRLI